MSVVLSIIAIAVLLLLIVVSVKRQRDDRVAKERAEARAYTGEAKAQHEQSLRRRAGVRAAHAERARTGAADGDGGAAIKSDSTPLAR
jgi:hypothetical protein